MVCSALEPDLHSLQSPPPNGDAAAAAAAAAAAPFRRVLLHPVVRDKQGRKMSKSLGNVIDPLHVIHGASLDTMLQELQAGSLPAEEVDRAAAALRSATAKAFCDWSPLEILW